MRADKDYEYYVKLALVEKKCSFSTNMHIGIYILVYTKYLFFSSKMDITPKSMLASSAKGLLFIREKKDS